MKTAILLAALAASVLAFVSAPANAQQQRCYRGPYGNVICDRPNNGEWTSQGWRYFYQR